MLLYWQFNTEPKRGKQNFVYPRRRAPHVESLVAATLQQSAQRPIFNTEEYRQKSIKTHLPQSKHSTSHRHSVTQPTPKNTKTSQQGHTSPQPGTLKKSPRGVQRGRGFTAPLRFSTASQSKKNQALCQESKNKTKNQPHNKQRKRKSQRKIKKKNKRKNKGEKA